jgi:rhodanese-related sulfurtransferase
MTKSPTLSPIVSTPEQPIDGPPVTDTPAADPATAVAHFQALAGLETDCWDVHASLDPATGQPRGFLLFDARSAAAYAKGHVSGAISMPHAQITEAAMADHPADALVVVYCNGPHCNGADKAALRLARLGRPVKKMIGGIEGWHDEGFDLVTD